MAPTAKPNKVALTKLLRNYDHLAFHISDSLDTFNRLLPTLTIEENRKNEIRNHIKNLRKHKKAILQEISTILLAENAYLLSSITYEQLVSQSKEEIKAIKEAMNQHVYITE